MSERPSLESLSEIFLQIAEAPLDRREALILELCHDEETRHEIRQLLDADSSEDPLLDHDLYPEPVELNVGDRVSNYRLTKELAHGGMGIVFLAEQLEPIHRNVALKVIKPGVDTREVIARFNAERQTLSLMDHPNIASVYDAGSTDSGRPYFVMELVDGQPITAYCEENRLTVRRRLEIFVSVCRAIQHAHQKGIIHRDIKPSNVLVGERGGQPFAKVIDFGVAKAINHTVVGATVATGLGQIVGTFDYMSPEQSRLNRQDVDTRSDIYSLGVLLYELLTDTPPFDRERLRSVDLEEMLKIIQQEDPPRPSNRLSEVRDRVWCDSPTQLFDERSREIDFDSSSEVAILRRRETESQFRKRIR
ncbi:MAG: serine/threonine-protein kinase, partial [Planctomycetota bacterium]